MIGKDDSPHAHERRRAHYGAQVVRIADAVENQQQPVPRPRGGIGDGKILERPRPHQRDNAAVQNGAGNARQFVLVRLPIGPPRPRHSRTERPCHGTGAAVEEKLLDPLGRSSEHCLHRRPPGDAQQLAACLQLLPLSGAAIGFWVLLHFACC
jgi:hypothetical protein